MGAPEFSKVTSYGRSNRLPSLLLLSTFLAGQVHTHIRSVQLTFHVNWSINLLDCLTLFIKSVYQLISPVCISSFFSPLLLLKTCHSAVFPHDALLQLPIQHHLPWYSQSHVSLHTCTMFLSSVGSSTTSVPLMTDENSWTLAMVKLSGV